MKVQLLLAIICLISIVVFPKIPQIASLQESIQSCQDTSGQGCEYQEHHHDQVQIWEDLLEQQEEAFVLESNPRKNLDLLLSNNKQWAAQMLKKDPLYFSELANLQKPEYLWIGCADSRVPANQITKLAPGAIFVHRNVANIVLPSDINALAVIQFAVEHLKVKDIIVAGHYGCGGVKASFLKHDHGPLESWLAHLRDLRGRYRKFLNKSDRQNQDLLVQLNVKTQVYNTARIPCVQQAWKEGRQLRIHGLVYSLKDGILKDLGLNINSIKQLPHEYRIIE